jgi:hypothetical protein
MVPTATEFYQPGFKLKITQAVQALKFAYSMPGSPPV